MDEGCTTTESTFTAVFTPPLTALEISAGADVAAPQRHEVHCEAAQTPDVCEIATRAAAGEPHALQTFAETGALLGDVLRQCLPAECDLVVLGGQIAHAAPLLLPTARQVLPVALVPAAHIADAALRGIGCYCTHADVTCVPQP